MIFDAAGNLYGTTDRSPADNPTAFKLSPDANGKWTHTVLHRFNSDKGGGSALSGLIFDAAGNLYGTATSGGNFNCDAGCGVVFEITP